MGLRVLVWDSKAGLQNEAPMKQCLFPANIFWEARGALTPKPFEYMYKAVSQS